MHERNIHQSGTAEINGHTHTTQHNTTQNISHGLLPNASTTQFENLKETSEGY